MAPLPPDPFGPDYDPNWLDIRASDPGGDSYYPKFRVPRSTRKQQEYWWLGVDRTTIPWTNLSELDRTAWYHGIHHIGTILPGNGHLLKAAGDYIKNARIAEFKAELEQRQARHDTIRELYTTASDDDQDRCRLIEIVKDALDSEVDKERCAAYKAMLWRLRK